MSTRLNQAFSRADLPSARVRPRNASLHCSERRREYRQRPRRVPRNFGLGKWTTRRDAIEQPPIWVAHTPPLLLSCSYSDGAGLANWQLRFTPLLHVICYWETGARSCGGFYVFSYPRPLETSQKCVLVRVCWWEANKYFCTSAACYVSANTLTTTSCTQDVLI